MSDKEMDLLEKQLLEMAEEHVENNCNGGNKVVEHHTKVLTLMAKVLIDVRHNVKSVEHKMDDFNTVHYEDTDGNEQIISRQKFIQDTINANSPMAQLKKTSNFISTLKPILWATALLIWFAVSAVSYYSLKEEKIERVNMRETIEKSIKELSEKVK